MVEYEEKDVRDPVEIFEKRLVHVVIVAIIDEAMVCVLYKDKSVDDGHYGHVVAGADPSVIILLDRITHLWNIQLVFLKFFRIGIYQNSQYRLGQTERQNDS